MSDRLIIVNFKAYEEASGEEAISLAESFSRLDKSDNVVVAPDLVDTSKVADFSVKVFGQHVDGVKPGSHTGSVTADSLNNLGVSGSLINHSERRLEPEEIRKSVEACKRNNLKSIVCAQTVEEVEKFSSYRPDYVAFEPPELIGGDLPVSEAEPEIIREAVSKTFDGVGTLTGAGIKDREDVSKSIELGCKGVLVASGVVKSDNPVKSLENLCDGL